MSRYIVPKPGFTVEGCIQGFATHGGPWGDTWVTLRLFLRDIFRDNNLRKWTILMRWMSSDGHGYSNP